MVLEPGMSVGLTNIVYRVEVVTPTAEEMREVMRQHMEQLKGGYLRGYIPMTEFLRLVEEARRNPDVPFELGVWTLGEGATNGG